MNVKTMFCYTDKKLNNPNASDIVSEVMLDKGEFISISETYKGPQQYIRLLSEVPNMMQVSSRYEWCYVLTFERDVMKYRTMFGKPM